MVIAWITILPSQVALDAMRKLGRGSVSADPLIAMIIDIVTAFVQDSGLRLLQPLVFDALRRGAKLRLITSDYLHITQADGHCSNILLGHSGQAE